MSISQILKPYLFLLFFLRRFGIKQVMLISMLAWVMCFGLFAYGTNRWFMDDHYVLCGLWNGI
jgi:hypothetical protein